MNDIIYAGKHGLTYSVSKHVHTSLELICCTGGEGKIKLDDTVLLYKKNNTAVIPPMMPHINESDNGFTNIFINIEDLSFELNEPLVITGDENNFLADAFRAAYYYFSGNDSKRSEFLSIYGDLISTFLSSYVSSEKRNSIVEQIERNILDNYLDPGYDLGEYLHSLPFSYDYITRLFKKTYGYTPNKFLTSKRLQAAASMLAVNEKHDIAKTARSSGFNDPLYFSRVFKKYYGISPSSYRSEGNNHKDDPDSMKIFIKD